MSEIETLGILEEIQSLVSDHLQVVSYKWLSRNFLVSSNAAKKLLQEFVEKHEDELQVICTVAGWLKKSPQTYHIRLVPMPKLAEVKHDFDGNCSVQVYSVQACIPKDPAAIWNIEFIQAEELYKQPATVDNCFRDNRFCGVSNSLVKRNAEGAPSAATASQAKGVGTSGQAATSSANKTTAIPLQQHNNLQQPSPKLDPPASDTTSVRSATDKSGTCDLRKEADKAKVAAATKKKGQSDKSTGGNGSSLANLWGRASSKSKSTHSSDQPKCAAQNNSAPDSADAQIRARETLEAVTSDDDDESDVNFKRASNGDGVKKRRVVFDDSDEDDYENAVNLGSPDPPMVKSCQDTKQKNRTLNTEHKPLNFNEHEESKPTVKEVKPINLEPMVKEDKAITVESEVKKEKASVAEPAVKKEKETSADPFEESFLILGKAKNTKMATSEGIPIRTTDSSTSNKNKTASTASGSPKRRKVLKTRIDERGREVTEVVWEGEEADMKDKSGNNNVKSPNGNTVNAEDNAAKIPANRAPMTKKSPAATNAVPSHTTGKAGGKKGANAKDPKQGNIMSFFKKKV